MAGVRAVALVCRVRHATVALSAWRHPATGEIEGVGIKHFPDLRPSGSDLKLEIGR